MKRNKIDFTSGMLFPFHFQLLGIIFLITGLTAVILANYWMSVLLLPGLFINTGYQGVEFNNTLKEYREYNSFFFLKFGKWQKSGVPEMIYINSGRTSQYIYTRITAGSNIRNIVFNAWLKWDDGSKIWLMTHKNKKWLCKRLKKIADFFNLPIKDNTMN